jgi:hypothetical protein
LASRLATPGACLQIVCEGLMLILASAARKPAGQQQKFIIDEAIV